MFVYTCSPFWMFLQEHVEGLWKECVILAQRGSSHKGSLDGRKDMSWRKREDVWWWKNKPSGSFLLFHLRLPPWAWKKWMVVLCGYLHYAYLELFIVFFFFNRNVLVGPQLSMWQLHQREPELLLYPDLCQMLISAANLFLIKFFSIVFPFKFLIIKKNAECVLLKAFHCCVLQNFELNQCWQWKEIIILNNK